MCDSPQAKASHYGKVKSVQSAIGDIPSAEAEANYDNRLNSAEQQAV